MKARSNSLLRLYGDCGIESFRLMKRHWLIIPGSMSLVVVWGVAHLVIGGLFGSSLITGFMLGFLQAALLGTFYSWLHDIALNRIPEWREFRYDTFVSVISIGFFLSLIQLAAQAFQSGGEFGELMLLFVQLVVVIWCNPAPEIIQHVRPDGMNGIALCYQFMREHGAVWLGAMVMVMSPLLLVSPVEQFLTTILLMHPVFPLAALASSWSTLTTHVLSGLVPTIAISAAALIVSSILGLWIMIFRSILFRKLFSGA